VGEAANSAIDVDDDDRTINAQEDVGQIVVAAAAPFLGCLN
jgi:hypothetical protein